ncbi:Trypsin [Popillia japonica]|uniref:Trypsin n=1 Tax=Popillia japonica TaxID=7064 RepID=A0AAW1MYY7_POPJA
MIAFILGAVLLATANANVPEPFSPRLDGRIVGGSSVDISKHPYQVSLLLLGSHVCGGAIISEKYVVTAAHCTYRTSTEAFSVRVGSSIRNSGGTVVKVEAIYQHPNFDYFTVDYDISVLSLSSSLNFDSNIAAIKLPSENQEFAAGIESVVTGWGDTAQGGPSADQLQAVRVPLVSLSDCQAAYSPYNITDRMLCAGIKEGGKDACQGDSGGPLVIDDVLVGVVSWGIGCAQPEYPGVYASVPNLRSYISEVSGI